jgi:hypothetical protein
MKKTHKAIKFEIEAQTFPLKAMAGMFGGAPPEEAEEDVTTEEDVDMLAKMLGGR